MQQIIDHLLQNFLNTTWLEIVAVIFGILSVWFARKENILVYPTGIVNVLIYVYLCFYAGLYADMAINFFYFIMSVYGWFKWTYKDNLDNETIHISSLNFRQSMFYMLVIAVSFSVIYFVLNQFTDSTVPIFDSFTTALFIAAMWLMATKKIENWLAWIIGDLLVIPLFAYKGLVFTSLQYFIFLVLAIMGYIEWNKRLKSKNKAFATES